MIKLENASVMGLEGAIRGMRNPLNSWDKSDSFYGCSQYGKGCDDCVQWQCNDYRRDYFLGPNDLELAKKLCKAGSDHRKFMRQIFVSVDITAPLYWYKEFDTYKVGTTANSTSTMHTIHKKPFEMSDFSVDGMSSFTLEFMCKVIEELEYIRFAYIETKDKELWRSMIQLLPSSYNQTRTVTMTYENLRNMYHARKFHKLDEWRSFCCWVESLPYSELIIE